jgi:hypothetical protein
MNIMQKHVTNQESDFCYCIYEFIKCDKNLDCISCQIANKYWDEIKNTIKEEKESLSDRATILKEQITS